MAKLINSEKITLQPVCKYQTRRLYQFDDNFNLLVTNTIAHVQHIIFCEDWAELTEMLEWDDDTWDKWLELAMLANSRVR